MKFSEYIKIGNRPRASLTKYEANLFGIELSKGWIKRYADVVISEEQIKQVYDHFVAKPNKNAAENRAQARAYRCIKPKTKPASNTVKLLYMMKNSHGDLKLGISIDPIKRARALTTGSGTATTCLAAWELEEEAVKIEAHLLKHFKAHKKEGEWFNPRSFSVQDVENNIPCLSKRVYEGKDVFFKKGFADTEDYEYLHIKHETEKAILFNVLGKLVWVAKSMIKSLSRETHMVTVPIGVISDKMKA